MRTDANKSTLVVYGVRSIESDWIFTESKNDRDVFFATTQRYESMAANWETCERIMTIVEWTARSTPAKAAA